MVEAKGNMRVVILTPYKRLLDLSGVTEIYFPIDHGTIGVLPGHAPMVSAVGTGVVVYTQNEVAGFYKVSGGVAEISGSSVTLLVDVGEDASTIDLSRAKSALERAQNRLAAKASDLIDMKRAEAARARALARIEAVELHAGKSSTQTK
ncbi:ATP synthase F1 subunit epsilon [Pigmentibacter sp. JX0631]|uniref:ATP synthase F1 subunit epsilon n=1 Tax=Pigmentibacter sp. JX0631 TaxID=2976982 RepID=UPI00246872AF|nr:ATP synthase F1 subunit epsilon [Pigmentibacter sp. JX0631]WGL61435.1 ATP synthase F1 subunit epsilon [Pigmentibacter sp. JX0631]